MGRLDAEQKRHDKRNLNYVLRSGLAGGIAGCVAKTVVAPLDRVKILFQANNPDYQKYAGTWSGIWRAGADIYAINGIRGLFQGHSATILRVFPYAAIKFMAYDQAHILLMPTQASETNFRRFSAGALSGMVSVCLTYPLELIRVRMAFQTRDAHSHTRLRPSLTQAITEIYYESNAVSSPTSNRISLHIVNRLSIFKFYRGFSVTLAGMIPYAGTSFLCWGFLRSHFVDVSTEPLNKSRRTPIADLMIGAVSGAIGQFVSYPFEVVRRRMQVGGLTRPDKWITWKETARSIWINNGFRGFYVGLSIGFIKIVPMTAVSFAVWQGGKQLLGV